MYQRSDDLKRSETMSRAFVKEQGPPAGDPVPDIAISEHPNYVTPAGLASLRLRRDNLLRECENLPAHSDDLQRTLRWLQARIASAIEIDPAEQPLDRVSFGATVTFAAEDGEHHYRIVGEDEADVETGTISYMSPLARALLGGTTGDDVTWKRATGDMHVEITGIHYE
jgi:transcription elongation factor GreB